MEEQRSDRAPLNYERLLTLSCASIILLLYVFDIHLQDDFYSHINLIIHLMHAALLAAVKRAVTGHNGVHVVAYRPTVQLCAALYKLSLKYDQNIRTIAS